MNFCRTKQKADPISCHPKQLNNGACVTRDNSAGGRTFIPVSCANLQHESSCESNTANAVTSKCDSTINHVQLAEETTWTENTQDYVKPSCDDGLVSCQSGTLPFDEILQEGWSCLKYGLSDTVTALNDSGCQLCVLRADTDH